MSISAGQEVQTVDFHVQPAANGKETIQVDAQEDREIVGFAMTVAGLVEESTYKLFVQAFTGVQPSGGDVSDLGGKFHIHGIMRQEYGAADGIGVESWDLPVMYDVDNALSWDWNEDVTLTVIANETGGSSVGVHVQIFYREI